MIDLTKLVIDIDKYYAHIEPIKCPEKLLEHLSLTQEYAQKIIASKNLSNVLSILEEKFELSENPSKSLFEEMFYSAIYLHDLGKINKNFQKKKMKNENFSNYKAKKCEITKHSPLSAKLYYNYFKPKIGELEKEDKKKFWTILFINIYAISKHHGYLGNFAQFVLDFKDRFSDDDNDFQDYEINISEAEIRQQLLDIENRFRQTQEGAKYYIYTKLLYSLIVSGDFYATTDYMNGVKTENFGLLIDKADNEKTILDDLIAQYEKTKIYAGIQDYKDNKRADVNDFTKVKDINILRSEMFIEVEENLLKNLEKNLYFLEAPTGSGKTNTAVNLSLKLAKQNNLNKIFYIFPFNTLVEQTKTTLQNCFEQAEMGNEIGVINSITPIVANNNNNNDENEKNYERALLDYQFINYPIVLTTHVQFFEWFFGTSRESNFAIAQLANSVVVLDEIQSYKNSIWKEMTMMFNYYAEILNIKFVIMSATLPRLNEFLENSNSVYLIENREKYFKNPLFKDRVKVDFTLIEKTLNDSKQKEEIFEKLILDIENELTQNSENKKVLIEFIKKKTANEFYKYLNEKGRFNNLELMTGDDNIAKRKEIIERVKSSEEILILVATQVIEAGVDIDMDLGYKDISILDAEEQFMGRINRSCKKQNCKVKFFNCDKCENIYKNDIRNENEMTLEVPKIRTYLENKNFADFYIKIIDKLNRKSKSANANNIENTLYSNLKTLDFATIKSTMKLIEDKYQKHTVFLNTTEVINGEEVIGKDVWNEYKNLLQNVELNYAEKRVKLSEIMAKVNYFTYETYKKPQVSYNDELGNILYFENGNDYFTNGKFDVEQLLNGENNYEFL